MGSFPTHLLLKKIFLSPLLCHHLLHCNNSFINHSKEKLPSMLSANWIIIQPFVNQKGLLIWTSGDLNELRRHSTNNIPVTINLCL